jgi:hypothetical protein
VRFSGRNGFGAAFFNSSACRAFATSVSCARSAFVLRGAALRAFFLAAVFFATVRLAGFFAEAFLDDVARFARFDFTVFAALDFTVFAVRFAAFFFAFFLAALAIAASSERMRSLAIPCAGKRSRAERFFAGEPARHAGRSPTNEIGRSESHER